MQETETGLRPTPLRRAVLGDVAAGHVFYSAERRQYFKTNAETTAAEEKCLRELRAAGLIVRGFVRRGEAEVRLSTDGKLLRAGAWSE